MATHIEGYEDEWRATLEDPLKLRRFIAFVNAPGAGDPSLAYVSERGQRRPATPEERAAGQAADGSPLLASPPAIAGPRLEVVTR